MGVKEKLINRFGMCNTEQQVPLDDKKLFVKHGLSVIAALAGTGKTTKMLEQKKIWENKGYDISYINFDSANSYQSEMIESPSSVSEIQEMFNIIKQHACENDIFIIDSLKALTSYYNCNIENNEDMYNLMLELKALIKTTKCSIILVHHIFRPKNLKNYSDSFYGARGIEEQCDSGFIYYLDCAQIVKSRLGYTRDRKIEL